MNYSIQNIDSIIFDMDGTLWNATESYAKIWNVTCKEFGIKTKFNGADLEQFMGMSIEDIMKHLLGDDMNVDKVNFFKALGQNEVDMMPTLGGLLYPSVKECLEKLHNKYRLFMLSNCSSKGLLNFVNYTGTAHLFDGLLTQGERPCEKSDNLRYMAQEYLLKCPTYVGDTQADCDQCHAADMPFVYADWGFGQCNDADWRFATIDDFTRYFLEKRILQ